MRLARRGGAPHSRRAASFDSFVWGGPLATAERRRGNVAKAVLAAGHAVVATGRNTDAVKKALGQHDGLLAVALDVTSRASAETAVAAAVERFGRIDVLVKNAGNFYAGYFEELTPEQVDAQLAVTLLGPMNVTRAVLPVMRKQRSGHIVTITSTAGIVGGETVSSYAAAKFGAEGWMESLAPEVAPFGLKTTLVEPGFFRTELLEPASTTWAELEIDDYAARRAENRAWWESMNGKQEGDPAKLAATLVQIVDQDEPPVRWVAGADAVAGVEQKARDLLAQVEAHRDISTALTLD